MTRARRDGGRATARIVLVVGLIGALLPLAYLLLVSLMTITQVGSGSLLPVPPQWHNYADAWNGGALAHGVLNSVLTAIGSTIVTLAIALPAAWAMVRTRTGGRFLAATVLSPWLLPPIVAVVPIFTLLRILGLNNTPLGLGLVYALANSAIAIWLLEGFIRRLPVELDEAAQLDGAGPWQVLLRVVVPLLTPGLVAVGVIVVVLNYNEFVLAAFLTQSADSQTLPVVLTNMLGERVQNYPKIAAASVIGVIPVFAGAVFLQRWLVAGLTSGSLK
jgi:multiple sugar transport system permease protein